MFCPPTFSGEDIFCINAHGIHWIIGAIFVIFSQLILMKIIEIIIAFEIKDVNRCPNVCTGKISEISAQGILRSQNS